MKKHNEDKEIVDRLTKQDGGDRNEIAKEYAEICLVSDRIIDKLVIHFKNAFVEEYTKGYTEFILSSAFINVTQCFMQGNLMQFRELHPEFSIKELEELVYLNLEKFFKKWKESENTP